MHPNGADMIGILRQKQSFCRAIGAKQGEKVGAFLE
jgi:hypothetical protein